MNKKDKIKKYLKKENAKWPVKLKLWPESEWPKEFRPQKIKEVWRSRDFLVQIFEENKTERISICKTSFNGSRWVDGIKWDDLQRLKRECGRGEKIAVEIYPSDKNIVNVANMRHLWILEEGNKIGWIVK